MRITFVISSLAAGGAQRVLVILTEALSHRGHHVTVITLNGTEEDFFETPKGVARMALGIRGLLQAIPGVMTLRKVIQSSQPHVVVSFIDTTNIMTLISTRRLKIPVVVSERIDPSRYRIGLIWEMLRRWTYPFAARIVVQTSRALEYFLPQFQSTACIVPNPIIIPKNQSPAPIKISRPSVMALGRFHAQKGFDLLLRAFALIKDRYPEWTLVIVGDGALRPELERLAEQLGLGKQARLPGQFKNPHSILKQADLFVMPSRFEGFPNALCEAMVMGLPVIATDCPSGPREIIRDGVDGILVENEDIEGLAEAMARLMSSEVDREKLSKQSIQVAKRFEQNKVIEMWECVLIDALKGNQVNV